MDSLQDRWIAAANGFLGRDAEKKDSSATGMGGRA
jgi:hypothetical protein